MRMLPTAPLHLSAALFVHAACGPNSVVRARPVQKRARKQINTLYILILPSPPQLSSLLFFAGGTRRWPQFWQWAEPQSMGMIHIFIKLWLEGERGRMHWLWFFFSLRIFINRSNKPWNRRARILFQERSVRSMQLEMDLRNLLCFILWFFH